MKDAEAVVEALHFACRGGEAVLRALIPEEHSNTSGGAQIPTVEVGKRTGRGIAADVKTDTICEDGRLADQPRTEQVGWPLYVSDNVDYAVSRYRARG